MTNAAALPVSVSGTPALDVAWRCARSGGELALERFRGEHVIDVKGSRNIVTETDYEVELRIKQTLRDEFPDHKILSEETSADTDASTGWTWVIDPIDGTKNYAMGIPFWCVNIALCLEGRPVVGLTYDPVHGEGFWAVAGEGAYCNDRRVHASERDDVASSVIGIDLGYDDVAGARQLDLMRRIFPDTQGIRITGSAALGIAYAAAGRFDLYTHLNVYPWDLAAGLLLVPEAGGAITGRDGSEARLSTGAFAAGGRNAHGDFMARYGSEVERLARERRA